MEVSFRSFTCRRCQLDVTICSHCDHGNVYCNKGCADLARRDSGRRASRKYQGKEKGKRAHAARQQAYLMRREEKMTHQGSPEPCPELPLPPTTEPPLAPASAESSRGLEAEREPTQVPAPAVPAAESEFPAVKVPVSRGSASAHTHACDFCGARKPGYLAEFVLPGMQNRRRRSEL